jgi:trigger factor
MQVAVETVNELERKLKITVPAEQVDDAVNKRLQELGRTAKMDGFRPGKAPIKVIENRFGISVRHEIIETMIRDNLTAALKQENLIPAGLPEITSLEAEQGKPLTFEASFETYPQIKLANVEGMRLERPAVDITDADVQQMLEKMRKQRSTWQTVDRSAQMGDEVVIDFVGSIDGKEFAGGRAENIAVVLGSGRMIPGFEGGLVGLTKDQQHTLSVTFPKDYGAEELAGKPAEFAITVREVKQSVLPELDDAFAQGFGVKEGGLEKLRQELRQNMERQAQRTIRGKLKQQVLDKLLEVNTITVPQALIKDEIENLRQQTLAWMKPYLKSNPAPSLPDEEFAERAKRRVALGLLLSEYIKQHELKPETEKVKELIADEASAYEQPELVEKFYYQNREKLAQIEALAIEEQMIDLVLGKAKITEKPVTFTELTEVKTDEQQEQGHVHTESCQHDHDHNH